MGRSATKVRRGTIGASLVALALVAACSSTGPAGSGGSGGNAGPAGTTAQPGTTQPAVPYPGAEWQVVDPASVGLDAAKLDEMAAVAEAAGSHCLAVVRDGKIAGEWYWKSTTATSTQEVFSATKSYTSILVGIAQGDGKLRLDDSASKYIPAWKGTPAEAVTVKNLLSNNSGRHWDYQTDYLQMAVAAPDKTQFSIDLAQDDPPGEVWVYNNAAIQTLDEVLKVATGEDPSVYAKKKLLDPIGMKTSEMTRDPSGNTRTFMGLQSTCRDMARFGYLLLNEGKWNGNQIVPAPYIEEATRPSTELNAAYGYLFWLNRKGQIASPVIPTRGRAGEPDGQMVPGAPEDTYWAIGAGNQIVAVSPSTGTVAVRLGPVGGREGLKPFGPKDLTTMTEGALVDE